MDNPATQNIILFDGLCNLCNSSVNFIIKKDAKNVFRFAALQSDAGKAIAEKYKIDISGMLSFILISNGTYYDKSTAALRIARQLPRGYSLLYIFIIIPKFIRDAAYALIAKNRYKWFGKKDSCMVPSSDIRDKFL